MDQELEERPPPIPEALMSWLEKQFPQRCPSLKDRNRVVWFKAGQRAVIDYLRSEQKLQNEAAQEHLLG